MNLSSKLIELQDKLELYHDLFNKFEYTVHPRKKETHIYIK